MAAFERVSMEQVFQKIEAKLPDTEEAKIEVRGIRQKLEAEGVTHPSQLVHLDIPHWRAAGCVSLGVYTSIRAVVTDSEGLAERLEWEERRSLMGKMTSDWDWIFIVSDIHNPSRLILVIFPSGTWIS